MAGLIIIVFPGNGVSRAHNENGVAFSHISRKLGLESSHVLTIANFLIY